MALIVCPTRELATQVMATVLKLNVREIGIGNALLIGGESMQKQLRKLGKRARIIVGTPWYFIYFRRQVPLQMKEM